MCPSIDLCNKNQQWFRKMNLKDKNKCRETNKRIIKINVLPKQDDHNALNPNNIDKQKVHAQLSSF